MNSFFTHKINPFLPTALIVFLATLWDFRLNNQIRIFDLISLLTILVSTFYFYISTNKGDYKNLVSNKNIFPFLSVVFLWAIYGLVNYHHKSSIGIIIGSLVLFIYCSTFKPNILIGKYLSLIISFHLLAFYTQFFTYIIFHYKLDYLSIINISSAIFPEDGNFFYRGSGLFREPSSYALNMFLMLTILMKFYQKHFIFGLGLLSIFLSGSLWGFFSFFVFVGCYFFNYYKLSFSNVKKLFIWLLLILSLMVGFLLVTKPSNIHYPNTINRIINFKSDGSFIERFQHSNINNINFSSVAPGKEMINPIINLSSDQFFLFGRGISTHFFFEKHPLNGYHLIFLSFGLFGTTALFFSFFLAIKNQSFKEKFIFTTLIAFSLSNYPLFTHLIFWLFLTFIFNSSLYAQKR
jgi:hypothetical protein